MIIKVKCDSVYEKDIPDFVTQINTPIQNHRIFLLNSIMNAMSFSLLCPYIHCRQYTVSVNSHVNTFMVIVKIIRFHKTIEI